MPSISFSRAVTYGANPKTCVETLLEKVDDFFFFNGRKVEVIRGFKQGKSEGVRETASWRSSALQTALKIALYCTVVILLLVFIAKAILRSIHKFHIIPTSALPINVDGLIGALPDSPRGPRRPDDINGGENNNTPSHPHLQFDIPTKLSTENIIKLKIRQQMVLSEDGTASKGKGLSDLDEYKNSWFEVFVVDSDTFIVTRRHLADDLKLNKNLLPFDVPTKLSSEQVLKLKLKGVLEQALATDGTCSHVSEKAFSDLSWYKDSFFYYKFEGDNYVVTRKRIEDLTKGEYPSLLAVGHEVRLNDEQFRRLNLDLENAQYSEDERCMHGTSNLPEYRNSRFKWKEATHKGQPCLVMTRY